MVARIYRPARSAMQSGKGKTKLWVLDYEQETARQVEPLMGYTSSSDMKQQLKLRFESKEDAVSYAERNGIAYHVSEPQTPNRRQVSYSDNFKFNRRQTWTH